MRRQYCRRTARDASGAYTGVQRNKAYAKHRVKHWLSLRTGKPLVRLTARRSSHSYPSASLAFRRPHGRRKQAVSRRFSMIPNVAASMGMP